MKKLLSLFCLVTALLMMPAISVSAATGTVEASGTCSTGVTWKLYSDGELVISGKGAIPDYTYTSTSSTSDAPWFAYQTDIESITIESGVTAIGKNAFRMCQVFTGISIPNTVTSIGDSAFRDCNGLVSITVPGSVKTIGKYGINSCRALKTIVLEEGITGIGAYGLVGNAITEIVIPDSVTSLGQSVLQSNYSLKTVTLGSGLRTIGSSAFASCNKLENINYHGTATSWNNVDTESGWNPNNVSITYVGYIKTTEVDGGTVSVNKTIAPIGETITVTATPSYGYVLYSIYVDGNAHYTYTFTVTGDHAVSAEFSKVRETSGSCGTGVYWSFYYDTGELVIRGQGAMKDYDYDEEDEEDKKKTPWNSLIVTKVTINEGVTSIGDYAFYNQKSLESISIASTVQKIGRDSFYNCDALTTLPALPAGVVLYGECFENCDGLTRIELPDTNIEVFGTNIFKNCSNLTYIKIPATVKISSGDIAGGTDLTTAGPVGGGYQVEFAWTDTIPDRAFSGSTLRYITIPSTVKSIGKFAFSGCYYLTDFVLPETLETISDSAFRDSNFINGFTIPDSVTSIGEFAFYDVGGMSSVVLPSGIEAIEDYTFGYSNITSVIVPEGVTTIGSYAFTNCRSLEYIELPSTLQSVGLSVLTNSSSAKVYYNGTQADMDNVTGLSGFNYYGRLYYLTNITIQDTVGGTVTVSNVKPYYKAQITITATPEAGYELIEILVDNEPVSGTAFTVTGDHVVSAVFKELPLYNGNCGEKATWKLYKNGELIIGGSGAMYDYQSTDSTPWYKYRTDIIKVTIEEGITYIGKNSFTEFSDINTLVTSSTVKTIGEHAFEWCSGLKNVTLAEGLETIEDYAFHVCRALEEIQLPSTLKIINLGAFETCTSLKKITIPANVKIVDEYTFHKCNALTEVMISEGVTTLKSNAFAECINLKTIHIPATVSVIESSPFNMSTAIEDVYYNGSKTAWNNLAISVPSTAKIHCTEYAITVSQAANGTIAVNKTTAAEGDIITVTATPADKCSLVAIYVDGKPIQGNSFTVSDNHVVSAQFKTVIGNVIGATLAGHTLSLEGNIGVNFYMELSEEVASGETAYMQFALLDGTKKNVSVKDAKIVTQSNKTYYVFSCEVSSAEMTAEIQAQFVVNEETKSEVYSFAANEYGDYILNNPSLYSEKEVAMVKALLNYAAYAQQYFGTNEDVLANAGLTDADKFIPTTDETALKELLTDYAVSAVTEEGLGTFASAYLVLESETTLKVRFKPGMDVNVDLLTFTVDGKEAKTVKSGSDVMIIVENIGAHNLGKSYVFEVTDGTKTLEFSCSTLSYGNAILNQPTSEVYTAELKALICALYHYNQVANTY